MWGILRMDTIRTLVDQIPPPLPTLPAELRERYGGDLSFPFDSERRPHVIGNFVSSVDGIVSYRIPGKAGGGEISGHNEPDRFIMGLLRASADAVLIGAGTLHATAVDHAWTAESIYPEAASLYQTYRKEMLAKPEPPITVVVSASGMVDLNRPMFRNRGLAIRILTTTNGRDRLGAAGANQLPNTEVVVLADTGEPIAPAGMLDYLRTRCGVQLLLHEGGPTLFGEFVAAGLVNEFFLTIAPQIAGCTAQHPRPTMVWETEFAPENAPWLRLVSLKQSGDHLYFRYRSRSDGQRTS